MRAMQVAILGAMLLGFGGAVFGVGLTRLFWAEDLINAQKLRAMHERTETAWRKTEEALRSQIEILRRKP